MTRSRHGRSASYLTTTTSGRIIMDGHIDGVGSSLIEQTSWDLRFVGPGRGQELLGGWCVAVPEESGAVVVGVKRRPLSASSRISRRKGGLGWAEILLCYCNRAEGPLVDRRMYVYMYVRPRCATGWQAASRSDCGALHQPTQNRHRAHRARRGLFH